MTAYILAMTTPVLTSLKKHSNITTKSFNNCLNHVSQVSVSGNTCYVSVITSIKPDHRLLFVNQLGPKDHIRYPIILEARDKSNAEGSRIYNDIARAGVQQSKYDRAHIEVLSKFGTLPNNHMQAGIYASNVQAAVDNCQEVEGLFTYVMSSVVGKTQDPAFDLRTLWFVNNFHAMDHMQQVRAMENFVDDVSAAKSLTSDKTAHMHLSILENYARGFYRSLSQ